MPLKSRKICKTNLKSFYNTLTYFSFEILKIFYKQIDAKNQCQKKKKFFLILEKLSNKIYYKIHKNFLI